MYSAIVLDHFHNPRRVGEIAHATAVAERTNPVCGDVLKLSILVREGMIAEARFKAQGCVAAVACGSWLAESVEGKRPEELGALTAADIEGALGGLPPASSHAAALALDVLKSVIGQIQPA